MGTTCSQSVVVCELPPCECPPECSGRDEWAEFDEFCHVDATTAKSLTLVTVFCSLVLCVVSLDGLFVTKYRRAGPIGRAISTVVEWKARQSALRAQPVVSPQSRVESNTLYSTGSHTRTGHSVGGDNFTTNPFVYTGPKPESRRLNYKLRSQVSKSVRLVLSYAVAGLSFAMYYTVLTVSDARRFDPGFVGRLLDFLLWTGCSGFIVSLWVVALKMFTATVIPNLKFYGPLLGLDHSLLTRFPSVMHWWTRVAGVITAVIIFLPVFILPIAYPEHRDTLDTVFQYSMALSCLLWVFTVLVIDAYLRYFLSATAKAVLSRPSRDPSSGDQTSRDSTAARLYSNIERNLKITRLVALFGGLSVSAALFASATIPLFIRNRYIIIPLVIIISDVGASMLLFVFVPFRR